jgi:uncharacterized cupin superfamily protein
VRRPVSRALGTTDLAMDYFELEPGDSFSGGLHTHRDQEEFFYVVEGTATFEVGRERETVPVREGECIRFAPREFQVGSNESDGRVVGLALGAPGASHDFADLESITPCRECDDETVHDLELTDEGAFRFTCTECGTDFAVEA